MVAPGGRVQEAKEDAARLAIYDQERAGLDLLTDGEAQRPSYDRHFLSGLTGVDTAHPEKVAAETPTESAKRDETGLEEYAERSTLKPKVIDADSWRGPISVDELLFLKANTAKPVKANVVGPLTLSRQLADHFYGDQRPLVMALAAALNKELKVLDAAGADVLQVDEPSFHFALDEVRAFGVESVERLVTGIKAPVIIHVCYGYALVYREKSASRSYPEVLEILSDTPIAGISLEYDQPGHTPDVLSHCGDKHVILGLLDLGNQAVETLSHIAERLEAALAIVPPERLHPASDCGMRYLGRDTAFGKITALVAGTRLVHTEPCVGTIALRATP